MNFQQGSQQADALKTQWPTSLHISQVLRKKLSQCERMILRVGVLKWVIFVRGYPGEGENLSPFHDVVVFSNQLRFKL